MNEERTTSNRSPQTDHVSDMDAVIWGVEKDSQLRLTITAVLVLQGTPDRDQLLGRLERMSRSAPGFRHRLVEPPLHLATPRWCVDPDFDLSYHLRWIGAPQPKTFDAVLEYVGKSTMSGLDHDRPLWQFTVIDGLDGDEAVVIIKFHHVLADGVGLLAIVPVLMDLSPEPRDLGPLPPVPEGGPMTRRDLFRDALSTNRERLTGLVSGLSAATRRNGPDALRHPIRTGATAARTVLAQGRLMKPVTETLSPLMVGRHGWSRFATLEVDLDRLKRAAKAHGATVNDAFVTAVATGLASYHEQHGAPVQELRATVAVSTRRPDDPPYGNRVLGGRIKIPVGTEDLAGYMTRYHELISEVREDVRQPLASASAAAFSSIGPLMAGYMGAMMKHCDFATTNIPGIPVPVYLGGAEVKGFYGFGPTMGTALTVTLVSYCNTAFIGVHVDAGAVPDIDVLVDHLSKGFDGVLSLGA